MCAEVGSDYSGSTHQTSMWTNILFLFSVDLMKSSRTSDFIALPNEDYLSDKFLLQ